MTLKVSCNRGVSTLCVTPLYFRTSYGAVSCHIIRNFFKKKIVTQTVKNPHDERPRVHYMYPTRPLGAGSTFVLKAASSAFHDHSHFPASIHHITYYPAAARREPVTSDMHAEYIVGGPRRVLKGSAVLSCLSYPHIGCYDNHRSIDLTLPRRRCNGARKVPRRDCTI